MTRTTVLPEKTLFSQTSTKRLVNGIQETDDLTLLKGAALLYPVVVFNTYGGPYETIVEFLSEGLGARQKEALERMCCSAATLDGYVSQIRTSELLDEVLRIPGVDRQAATDRLVEAERILEARGGYPQEDPFSESNPVLTLFLSRRLQIPCYESATRAIALQALVRQIATRVDTEEPLEVGVGELNDLSWDAILELRRSKFIGPFREFMFTHSSDKRMLESEIQAGLWTVIGNVTPSTTASVVQRLAALVPTGVIPNPYDVYREVKEGVQEWQLYKEYGWLFFLQQARERLGQGEGDA